MSENFWQGDPHAYPPQPGTNNASGWNPAANATADCTPTNAGRWVRMAPGNWMMTDDTPPYPLGSVTLAPSPITAADLAASLERLEAACARMDALCAALETVADGQNRLIELLIEKKEKE